MRRFTKKQIGYQILISFFTSIAIVLGILGEFFSEEEEFELTPTTLYIGLGIFALVFLVSVLYVILLWKLTKYELKEEEIVLQTGVLFRRKKIVRYDRIHAIDYKQNIFQRLFSIKTLTIDSGSTVSLGAEVYIVESGDRISALEAEIRSRMNQVPVPIVEEKTENEVFYQYTGRNKFLYSLILTFGLFLFLLFVYIVLVVIFMLIGEAVKDGNDVVYLWLVFLSAVIFFFVFSYLYNIIRYFKYQVFLKDNYLIIRHGILTKVNNVLKLDRIKGVKVEQGLLQRMFGLATIKLEVVGFGLSNENNANSSHNFYIPLCHKKEVNQYIAKIKPGMELEEKKHRAPIRGYRYFFSLKIYILMIIFLSVLPLLFLFPYAWAWGIYFGLFGSIAVFIMIRSVFAYRISGIYYDEVKMIVSYGAFIKKTMILPIENITGIDKVDTYLRRRRNIASFVIHFFNNAFNNTVRVHLLDSSVYQNLTDSVKY